MYFEMCRISLFFYFEGRQPRVHPLLALSIYELLFNIVKILNYLPPLRPPILEPRLDLSICHF